jgi:hypothetical protein
MTLERAVAAMGMNLVAVGRSSGQRPLDSLPVPPVLFVLLVHSMRAVWLWKATMPRPPAGVWRLLGVSGCTYCAQVPVWLLKATRSLLRSFQWARDAADRLVRRARSLPR